MPSKTKLLPRQKIKFRIRKRIIGTAERPRLVIFRSLSNIYAQLVDDVNSKTICSVSSVSKDVKKDIGSKITKTDKSKIIGKMIAEKAGQNNIKKVVFDRNGYLYHGRVKAIADAAREAGLEF
jgi:large subunit ribosomal protein L18